MAQLMTSKAIAIVLAVAVYFAAVSAQEFESAAPAPTMDKGTAYSFGISGAVICSSLVLSMLAFFKN